VILKGEGSNSTITKWKLDLVCFRCVTTKKVWHRNANASPASCFHSPSVERTYNVTAESFQNHARMSEEEPARYELKVYISLQRIKRRKTQKLHIPGPLNSQRTIFPYPYLAVSPSSTAHAPAVLVDTANVLVTGAYSHHRANFAAVAAAVVVPGLVVVPGDADEIAVLGVVENSTARNPDRPEV
jgi:hypothetical protein